ncbi:MAG: DoxX family protein [Candidatus Staskawiczbacteria bacterium]|nr:DoxX family protein [Candidatus Staskawiczbacteria bacterium]
MFVQLIQYNNIGLFILRLAVAAIFIYHSLPKLKNAKAMAQAIGMSTNSIFVLGLVELLASIGLILGFYTQLSALLLAIVMAGAIWFKTMKWKVPFAAMDKTGWEFDLILLAANIVILFGGGGSIGI